MKYIVANWKMNLTVRESVALARGVLREMRGVDHVPQVILCPSFTALHEVYKSLARSRVALGAQNCGPHTRAGAFTGEISPSMLEDTHCQYVIIGHSERRHLGEEQALIRQKLQAAYASRLVPMLCVGESYDDHEHGNAFPVVEEQLKSALYHIDIPVSRKIMIAYEPVWAISTNGMTEEPVVSDIVEMHTHIRELVSTWTGRSMQDVVVLYGGSVDEDSAYRLLREPQIDGVLVGGASLKLHNFSRIIQVAEEIMSAQEN